MKLYFSPGACSLASHIVLQEAGLTYTIEKVDLRAKVTASGADFKAINPKGSVPALVLDNGELLTEGVAIMQYLADCAPQTHLAPAAGTMPRYRLLETLNYITSEVHKGFSPLFNPANTEEVKAAAVNVLQPKLALMSKQLGEQDYLFGTQFTIADAYLFVVLSWARIVKLSLEAYPNLIAFQARVAARPTVHAAMTAEGLIK